jgi:uncharacterized membrane protein YfcA
MVGIETLLILLVASILIGIIGSMLGIGGGIFLIPIMTLGLAIDIKVAAATSLVTIIVTSSTSASGYLKDGFVNVGLGMFLEMFTVTGAIIGAVLVVYLRPDIIEVIFGIVLIYAAFYMRLSKDVACRSVTKDSAVKRSRFTGRFYDRSSDQTLEYDVKDLPKGAGASFVAGNLSGLIGVGGGIVMVPAMNLWMGVPMKAASATSTFILGVTAVASALVYLSNGLMAPVITAVAAIGIFIGAMLGTRTMPKITGGALRTVFSITIIAIAVLMFLRAGGVL